VKNEHDYREHQQDMNGPSGNMKRQKPKQPHDHENRSNDSKHLSLLLRLFNDAAPPLHARHRRQNSSAVQAHYQVSSVGILNLPGTIKSGTGFSLCGFADSAKCTVSTELKVTGAIFCSPTSSNCVCHLPKLLFQPWSAAALLPLSSAANTTPHFAHWAIG
jgi:hypothetical protein